MAFRVGQKVVCVDDGKRGYPRWARDPLTKGAVYTITGIEKVLWNFRNECSLNLAEAVNRTTSDDGHLIQGYDASRFRPVIEKSTDTGMAILREILDRETVKDREPVHQH